MRLAAPDKLMMAAGAGLLCMLVCSTGCGYKPVSHASSSEAISRTAADKASKSLSDGQKPAASARSAEASKIAKTESAAPAAQSAAHVEPAVAEKPPASGGKGRARNISFDTIKFEMEKRDRFVKTMLTPTIRALDGKRVKLRGFMFPTSMRAGIASFILVRDNQECCFGPGAALFDALAVQMRAGETTEYAYFPITVEGIFHIDPIENPLYGQGPLENSHLYVFRMDDALVTKR